jgi:hypothetical protein
MRERGPSFILGEAKLPLLDESQVSTPKQSEHLKEGGALLGFGEVRIDEMDDEVEGNGP